MFKKYILISFVLVAQMAAAATSEFDSSAQTLNTNSLLYLEI